VVAGFGEKAAVTPFGKPDTEGTTLPLKPFDGVMVTVTVAWLFTAIFTLSGESVSVKSPGIWLPDEPPPHPGRKAASQMREINVSARFTRSIRARFLPKKLSFV
jgi:hypothetical protein